MAKEPTDFSQGLQQYWEFHQLEPKKITKADLVIPKQVLYVGEGVYMNYRSKKWEGKSHDYTHDHEAGVKVHIPIFAEEITPGQTIAEVPTWLRSTKTLVRLGSCLGFAYMDEFDETIEAAVRTPLPDLYCTPDGKALLVIQNFKEIYAMLWGGYLNVTERGIVG